MEREALENIEEIAGIEGIDGIFIGPFDLSISMGMPGQFDHPEFQKAIDRILGACKDAGKLCMIFTGSPEEAKSYINGDLFRRLLHNVKQCITLY